MERVHPISSPTAAMTLMCFFRTNNNHVSINQLRVGMCWVQLWAGLSVPPTGSFWPRLLFRFAINSPTPRGFSLLHMSSALPSVLCLEASPFGSWCSVQLVFRHAPRNLLPASFAQALSTYSSPSVYVRIRKSNWTAHAQAFPAHVVAGNIFYPLLNPGAHLYSLVSIFSLIASVESHVQ